GGRVGGVQLDARDDTQLGQVAQAPLPVRPFRAGGRDAHARRQRLVAGGAERLQLAQDRLAARPDLLGPALVRVAQLLALVDEAHGRVNVERLAGRAPEL